MYTRVTTFQADPSKLDEMAAQVDGVAAEISGIAGLNVAHVSWRDDGAGNVTAISRIFVVSGMSTSRTLFLRVERGSGSAVSRIANSLTARANRLSLRAKCS